MSRPAKISVQRASRTVALVGNPNTGKSTLFTALTGYRQHTGNYPGTTVEKRTGVMRTAEDGASLQLVDLPGSYSLAACAEDETIVLDVLLGCLNGVAMPDAIVAVVDASNLTRNLFFATQVMELGRPVVIALNMVDVAAARGIHIDAKALSRTLGVAVVPVVATKQLGVARLKEAIAAASGAPAPRCGMEFPAAVLREVDELTGCLSIAGNGSNHRVSRVEALQALLDRGGYHANRLSKKFGGTLAEQLDERRRRIEESGESIAAIEARVRYDWITRVVQDAIRENIAPQRRGFLQPFDAVATHRVWGLALLIVLLTVCFQAVYSWAAPLMALIDGGFSALGDWIAAMLAAGALRSLVIDGVVAGVGAVLTFLPQILILFFFLAILEDCGYMARAALLLDRWMGCIGLNGRSLIPLVSSFACAVPGIMATRTIPDRRERLVTILIAPLMSCSARLPVYTLMIGAFIPATPLLGGWFNLQALTLLAFYAIGVLVAIPAAWVLQRTVLKGQTQSFFMELPSYKWPSPRTVAYKVYVQGREFCVSAGTIIFAVTVVVWAAGYYPRPSTVAAEYQMQRTNLRQTYAQKRLAIAVDDLNKPGHTEDRHVLDGQLEGALAAIDRQESGAYLRQSVLGRLGRWIEPVVKPLGWDWRIGTAAIASFPAREVVIATMGTIYNLGEGSDETSAGLRQKLKGATWPDGRSVFNIPVALSIMVFFALCCQCAGTLAVIKRETRSWRWPLLTFSYMTVLAYFGALVTYQITSRLI